MLFVDFQDDKEEESVKFESIRGEASEWISGQSEMMKERRDGATWLLSLARRHSCQLQLSASLRRKPFNSPNEVCEFSNTFTAMGYKRIQPILDGKLMENRISLR